MKMIDEYPDPDTDTDSDPEVEIVGMSLVDQFALAYTQAVMNDPEPDTRSNVILLTTKSRVEVIVSSLEADQYMIAPIYVAKQLHLIKVELKSESLVCSELTPKGKLSPKNFAHAWLKKSHDVPRNRRMEQYLKNVSYFEKADSESMDLETAAIIIYIINVRC
jgi:hypothetical protein